MRVTKFMKLFFTLWVSIFLFTACSVKEYTPAHSMLITFKSDTFRFNDMGYLRKSKRGIEMELFSAGQLIEHFIIETNVCTNRGCISKEEFNKRYLHANYHKDIVQNIFRGEPIFNSRELIVVDDGFKQNIKGKTYTIIYKVIGGSIYFKAKINGILIKIREIK